MGNEKLTVKYDFVWDVINDAQKAEVMAMGEDYKAFMDASKTERTCTDEIVRRAKEAGYVDINTVTKLEKGDKVYSTNRGKNVVLAVIGEEPVANGVNIVGSHIDSPRLDLKQNPLIENGGMAMFKTHYYGGVRKYQWVALPLALYGVVIMANGEKVEIAIGDDENDPIFYISDLLPHLAADQNKKTLAEGVAGEDLNPICGTLPVGDEKDANRFKMSVLKMLNEKYGIVEEDFTSAELEL
ncbi:MAG: aminopeptidase, partial [Clostridia bacterium]|nr:aminopeptidase [Clostridia bacterium]